MDSAAQLSLLSAGCQPWNFQVVAASGRRLAYCATLSVYVYEVRIKYHVKYQFCAITASILEKKLFSTVLLIKSVNSSNDSFVLLVAGRIKCGLH